MPLTAQKPPPRGHGLVRVADAVRRHVGPHHWQDTPATDYWIVGGSAGESTAASPVSDLTTASDATHIAGLDSWGWQITGLTQTSGQTGDFFSSSDDGVPAISSDGSGDILSSPPVLGGFAGCLAAAQILGYMPTKLVVEAYAAFPTASADEAATYLGLGQETDGSVVSVYSNATVFVLQSAAAAVSTVAVDNAYHLFRLLSDSVSGLASLSVDGVLQANTAALLQDVWPAGLRFAVSTSNRISLAWGHCWYE